MDFSIEAISHHFQEYIVPQKNQVPQEVINTLILHAHTCFLMQTYLPLSLQDQKTIDPYKEKIFQCLIQTPKHSLGYEYVFQWKKKSMEKGGNT